MSSGATGYDSKTYEHIKNFYDTQAWLPKNAVIVNQKAFDALDKPTQAAVLKAGGRRRNARLEAVRGEERLVSRPAEAEGHEHRQAVASSSPPTCARSATTCSPEWLRKAGDEGTQGRSTPYRAHSCIA